MADESDPLPSTDDPFGLEALWRLVEGEPANVQADPLVGMTVGGVQIVRMLAEGGMGRVYEGLQESPRRAVAVKVLRPGAAARAAIRRFLQEAQILGRLRHPWICEVHAAGAFEATGVQLPYFIMELIHDGLPITEFARRQNLPVEDRLSIFAQVCDAVAHAHAAGVVHRDLKPGNVLVDSAGYPRVIDFGIARGNPITDEFPGVSTTTGHLLGTIQYMSPEQVGGVDGSVNARSDVYTLGVMLHELVTGLPPYNLSGLSLLESIHAIREARVPLVRIPCRSAAGVPLVIDKCLAKNPSGRYADAAELAADLRVRLSSAPLSLLDRLRHFVRLRAGLGSLRWAIALAICLGIAGVFAVGRGNSPRLRSALDALAAGGGRGQPADVPARSLATIPFQYSFTSCLDEDADLYLFSADNTMKWNDPREDLRVNYWGPEKNDVEGILVYRFQFPGRTARITVMAEIGCWDFQKHHTGFGRGCSAVEASRDGIAWVTLQDDIRERRWGVNCKLSGDLPPGVLGSRELWLRIRLLTEDADPRAGYTVAQFARSIPAESRDVFTIEAECVPPVEER